MRTSLVVGIASAVALSAVASGVAQSPAASGQPQQQVLPPEARYWMGATTGSGMLAMAGMVAGGRPSMATMMKMASGGMPTEGHTLSLKLGSTLAPKGEPEAFHTMPPGAQVNKPIYLETPEPGKPQPGGTTGYQTPKGQISFYWGCGEKAGPGQPVVLTFDKLMRGENDPELEALEGSVSARSVRTPTPGNSKTYGDWPHGDRKRKNRDLEALFRAPATLAGPHLIEGTYSPKIEFTLPADKTFMEGVRYTSTTVQASGAIALNWSAPARATGYSVGVMAPEKVGDDSANIVMWSSAERPATFVVMQDLTPAEVNRLIGLKAVLPPSTTNCTVPAEVVKATKDGSMLMFTAFGDEATYIHPSRPADPKVPWDQEWFSRVSFKSVRMDMISPQGVMDMMGAMSGRGASQGTQQSDEEYCRELEAEQAKKKPSTGGIGGMLGRFGRRGGQQAPATSTDPRCANLKKQ